MVQFNAKGAMMLTKGECIATDANGKPVAWLALDENGKHAFFNDEGALVVITQIGQENKQSNLSKEQQC